MKQLLTFAGIPGSLACHGKRSVICFLLVVAASALPMLGDTLTDYTITFTTTFGSPAPTSGSFTYNSTTPGFSNFLVKWDGTTFDLTGLHQFGQFLIYPCAGQTNSPAYAFSVMAQTAALCPSSHFEWDGYDTKDPPEFDFAMLDSQQLNVDIGVSTPNAPLQGNHARGNWSITAVATPEPGTISLFLSGMGGVSLLVRRKRLRRSLPRRRCLRRCQKG